jgi:diaminobutyrate-2-oxoglutarate transaminase
MSAHAPLTELTENQVLLQSQAARESSARSYPRRLPLAIRRAQGIHVTDMDGTRYLDCLSGAGTLALGHNHPVVVEAIRAALDQQLPLHTLDLTTPIKEAFVDELYACLPPAFARDARIHFCGPTGADAIEAALKLAKIATGRGGVFAFHGGYHGSTHAAMSLSGSLHQKGPIPGLMPEVHFLPYPYDYRCPFGVGGELGHRLGTRYLRTILGDPESGIRPPAALVLEVVQGEGGAIPAPPAWLREVRDITEEHGIPLVVDEVQTGFGRTGRMFAFEHAGILPDVLVLSKAVGGSLPLSVIVYRSALDRWQPGAHIGTFRGNQLAMAAGLASLRYIRAEGLVERAAARGEQLRQRLADLRDGVGEIGDVRGAGLMIGVEVVEPGRTDGLGQPLANPRLASAIQRDCLAAGLILEVGGRHGAVVRFLPPLTVTEREVDTIAGIFSGVVRRLTTGAGAAASARA